MEFYSIILCGINLLYIQLCIMECIINSLCWCYERDSREGKIRKSRWKMEIFQAFLFFFLIFQAYIKTANIISHWRMKIFHEYSSLLCNHDCRMKKCYLNSLKICFTTGGVEETSWNKIPRHSMCGHIKNINLNFFFLVLYFF